jgi:hypothetical protein
MSRDLRGVTNPNPADESARKLILAVFRFGNLASFKTLKNNSACGGNSLFPAKTVWNAFDTSSGVCAAKSGSSKSFQSLANADRQLSARPLTADGTTLTGRPRPRFAENLSSGLLDIFLSFFVLLNIAVNSREPQSNYT